MNPAVVCLIKEHGKNISYGKIAKVFPMSRSVYYSIVRGDVYKWCDCASVEGVDPSPFAKEIKTAAVVRRELYDAPEKNPSPNPGVYLIQNQKNGKCYVGSSYKVSSRLFWHHNMLIRGVHPNNHLQSSVNKHGIESFRFIPILTCPKEYCRKLEQWVKDNSAWDCAYNMASDCSSAGKGRKLTQDERNRISEINKGRVWTEGMRQRLKERLKGIKESDPNGFAQKRLANFKGTEKRAGESNGGSKLTDLQREDIMSLIGAGVRNRDIVMKYPWISSKLITEVKSGRTWRHLQNRIEHNGLL